MGTKFSYNKEEKKAKKRKRKINKFHLTRSNKVP